MKTLLKGGYVIVNEEKKSVDISIEQGRVFAIASEINNEGFDKVIHCDNFFIAPAFVDVHVHLREPGFSYKETIATGTAAAARGGYSTVFSMPNLTPAPVDAQSLQVQLEIIDKEAKVKVLPYGAITQTQSGRGGLSQMEEMADKVIGFTDDGKGIQAGGLMREAMHKAKSLGKLIVAHCEDEEYDTYEPESEWKQVERDIALAKETGCPYHICHISTKETVELVRKAKGEGVDITCETAPHYLIFDNQDLPDEGRFKMNPPIRGRADKEALIQGIQDGTIDMIATDHAPHSEEEKSKGFKDSMFGIIGMETAFPVLYTHLVKPGTITLEKLIDLMAIAPRKRFGLPGGEIQEGEVADLVLIDLEEEYEIDSEEFLSKGRSTPFEGMDVFGRIITTLVDGEIK
ncbi:MAG: dihydroorotase [Anaerovoracaceae bacterium]